MSAIIRRNVYEPGGLVYLLTEGRCQPLPPEVAYLQRKCGHWLRVTWAEVMADRRQAQATRLKHIDYSLVRRAVRVRVYFNPYFPYEGWHTYLHWTPRGSHWVRCDRLIERLLELWPVARTYAEWKPAFARLYQCGRWGGRPYGVRFAWAWCDGAAGAPDIIAEISP